MFSLIKTTSDCADFSSLVTLLDGELAVGGDVGR